MTHPSDTFRNWVLGIAAAASVAYGGWLGAKITDISHSMGTLEGRESCRGRRGP